ncbi:hypothetical protein RHCRD62_50067 [Rhodococcus sp. RD6.2]|nr:hypothetical protein RHCRD62_50067 [Rhodococcus sp. RD6.2]
MRGGDPGVRRTSRYARPAARNHRQRGLRVHHARASGGTRRKAPGSDLTAAEDPTRPQKRHIPPVPSLYRYATRLRKELA